MELELYESIATTSLVTGGAGFIGSHLVKALVARGDLVAIIDKLGYAGRQSNLESLVGNQQHRLFVLDIRDSEAVHQILTSNPTSLSIGSRKSRRSFDREPIAVR